MAIPSRGDQAYDEKHNNYFTLINAMRFTTEGLEGIVKRSMKDLYEKIFNKCHMKCNLVSTTALQYTGQSLKSGAAHVRSGKKKCLYFWFTRDT